MHGDHFQREVAYASADCCTTAPAQAQKHVEVFFLQQLLKMEETALPPDQKMAKAMANQVRACHCIWPLPTTTHWNPAQM